MKGPELSDRSPAAVCCGGRTEAPGPRWCAGGISAMSRDWKSGKASAATHRKNSRPLIGERLIRATM